MDRLQNKCTSANKPPAGLSLPQDDLNQIWHQEPEKENFDNYMAVYDLFENIFKNEKVEVVTKNGLSKYIGSKILKDVMYV